MASWIYVRIFSDTQVSLDKVDKVRPDVCVSCKKKNEANGSNDVGAASIEFVFYGRALGETLPLCRWKSTAMPDH